eukprot:549969-Amphidinium_carterae.1
MGTEHGTSVCVNHLALSSPVETPCVCHGCYMFGHVVIHSGSLATQTSPDETDHVEERMTATLLSSQTNHD